MAGLYDNHTRNELLDEIQRWKTQAAKNAGSCLRMSLALKLARQYGISSRAFHGEVSVMLADWFDAGMPPGVPWPSSPLAADWLRQHGYSNCDGKIGIRATMTLADQH